MEVTYSAYASSKNIALHLANMKNKLVFQKSDQCITHVQITGSNSLEIISNQDYDICYCTIDQVRNHIQLKKPLILQSAIKMHPS